MSPKLMSFFLLMNSDMPRVMSAGAMKCITAISMMTSFGSAPSSTIELQVTNWPTRPEVPMPEPEA